jgi:uncharacterized membrane protein YhaH (DUF805 family)
MKNLELLYLIAAYGMGCVIYFINRNKDYLTVSETAANTRLGRQAFFWGLLVSGGLFAMLMFKWVIPRYQFGAMISVLTIVLFIFQVLTGIIPARGKRLNAAHLVTAFGLAASMVAMVATFALHASLHGYVRALCLMLVVVMVGLLAAAPKLSTTKYFKHQNIFLACWHIALFMVVYFG